MLGEVLHDRVHQLALPKLPGRPPLAY
jgi:hypothetical protein